MIKRAIILSCFIIAIQLSAQTTNSYLEGIASIDQHKYSVAIEKLNKAIEDKPEEVIQYLYRGIAYYCNNNIKLAQSDFEFAANAGLNNGNLWLAKVYAQDINPTTSVNYLNIYLKSATILEAQSAISDSAFKIIHFSNEWFNLVSERKPDIAEQAIKDAGYAKKTGKYTEVSTKITEQLIDNNSNAYLYYARGLVYRYDSNIGLAINDFKKAYELNPDDVALKEQLASAYLLNGDNEKALQLYNELLKKHPENFSLYLKTATASLKSGNISEAQKTIKTYLQYFTSNIDARFLSSRISYELGSYMEALKEINKLLLNETPQAEWYHHRGLCYYRTGIYKYAAADFSMALDLDPAMDESDLYMGKTQLSLGHKENACYFLKKASKAGNREAQILIIDNCQ